MGLRLKEVRNIREVFGDFCCLVLWYKLPFSLLQDNLRHIHLVYKLFVWVNSFRMFKTFWVLPVGCCWWKLGVLWDIGDRDRECTGFWVIVRNTCWLSSEAACLSQLGEHPHGDAGLLREGYSAKLTCPTWSLVKLVPREASPLLPSNPLKVAAIVWNEVIYRICIFKNFNWGSCSG